MRASARIQLFAHIPTYLKVWMLRGIYQNLRYTFPPKKKYSRGQMFLEPETPHTHPRAGTLLQSDWEGTKWS